MACAEEKMDDTQIKDLPSNQEDHLEELDGKISKREEQMELCDVILNDLLEIQKIVAKKGLENTTLPGADN